MSRRVAAPVAAFFVFGSFWGAWAALLPETRRATGTSDAELGLALAVIAFAATPAMVLAGRLADRLGRTLVAGSAAAFAVAAVLPGLATSWTQLAAAGVALGIATGAFDVLINTRVAALEAEGRRLMGYAHAAFSAGVLVGSVATGIARDLGAGRRPVLLVVGAFVLAVAVLNRTGERHVPAPRGGGFRAYRSLPLLALGLLCGLGFVVESSVEIWGALHLERTLDARPAVSGLGPGLYAGAMVAGRLFQQTGRLSDTQFLVGGGLTAAVGTAVAAAAPSAAVALAGFVVAGVGISVVAPTFFSLAGRGATPQTRATAMSAVTSISYLGFLIAPAALGAVANVAGLRVAFLVVAAIALAMAAGSAIRPRREAAMIGA